MQMEEKNSEQSMLSNHLLKIDNKHTMHESFLMNFSSEVDFLLIFCASVVK